MNKLKFFILLLFALLFAPKIAVASVLSLSPQEGAYGPGDTFALDVLIDDLSECVNAFSVELDFPKDFLQVVDFLDGESLINLWLEKPESTSISQANSIGKILFSGGVPGGYCGRIPGDPGRSNLIARIIFSIPGMIISEIEKDYLEINFSRNTTVLLNDGLGTKDEVFLRGAAFQFLSGSGQIDDSWKKQIKEDTIRPEPFIIQLRQDPNLFNGRYYIIFNTSDKQSGIDRYEVLEIRADEKIGAARDLSWYERIFKKPPRIPEWKTAKMPYVLEDQSLLSTIRVRAIDKAGNERYVEYVPPEELKAVVVDKNLNLYLFSLIGFIFLGLIIVFVIIRKTHAKKNKEALPKN